MTFIVNKCNCRLSRVCGNIFCYMKMKFNSCSSAHPSLQWIVFILIGQHMRMCVCTDCDLFIQMVISQLLLNKIEWNKFNFVANLIAFKMNTNLTLDQTSIISWGWKSHCMFFSDTVCTRMKNQPFPKDYVMWYYIYQYVLPVLINIKSTTFNIC